MQLFKLECSGIQRHNLHSRQSSAKFAGDRIAPIFAKAAVRDANANRRLPTFIFVDFNKPRDTFHHSAIESVSDDRFDTLVVFHVAGQDRIQHLVRW